jgi:hypothetical protein
VGLRACLDTKAREKIISCLSGIESHRPVVQFVARHYTDSVFPAPHTCSVARRIFVDFIQLNSTLAMKGFLFLGFRGCNSVQNFGFSA